MSLFNTVLQLTAHPAAQPFLQRLLGGDPEERRRRQMAELRQALQETLGTLGPPTALAAASAPITTTTHAASGPAPSTDAAASLPALAPIRDQMLQISAALKESLRFAREDGLTHPEVQKRLADTQEWAVDLERFQLRPEALTAMPPAARAQAEALLVPLRRLRQQIGEARDVGDLTEASALAGQLASYVQVATAVGGMPGVRLSPPPTPPSAAPADAYSQYAPDMTVDTSCLACTRSHLAGVQGALERAAQEAATKGWADPAVQDRLAMAQEELTALLTYDLTPDQIAKSPPADQAVVQPLVPGVQQLLSQLRAAQSPQDVAQAAAQARALRQQLTGARPPFTALARAPVPTTEGTARVTGSRSWLTAVDPSTEQVATVAPPLAIPTAFDRLAAALEARGVPVRIRQLPATDTAIIEGLYAPDTNSIQLAPFALAKDPYAVQTLIHEAAHALLHGPSCLPHPPADHRGPEQQAEDAVVVTMVDAGLPLETREGTVIEPGARRIDWATLTQELGPAAAENLRWASQWMTQAMHGTLPPDQVTAPCPHPQEEVSHA